MQIFGKNQGEFAAKNSAKKLRKFRQAGKGMKGRFRSKKIADFGAKNSTFFAAGKAPISRRQVRCFSTRNTFFPMRRFRDFDMSNLQIFVRHFRQVPTTFFVDTDSGRRKFFV